ADEQIGIAGDVAYFEQRGSLTQKPRHVENRAQRLLRYAERNHARGMAVDDGLDVGARAIDSGVNEAFEIDAPASRVERLAREVEGDHVVSPDKRRRHVAGEKKVFGGAVMPRAHMSE